MHILLIITDYGSFNNFLSDLAVNMSKSGHKVDVICSSNKVIKIDDKFDYESLGVNIHFVSFPRGFNILKQLKASVSIHKLVVKINPDLVHIHFTTGIFTTVFYKRLPYLTIGTFHGLGYPMISGIKKYLFKTVESFCFSRLDQIYVLNKFDYDIIKGSNKKKTFMVDSAGVGCDLLKFEIDSVSLNTSDLRKQLNIDVKDFVITFTGRFVSFKGFDLVIKSFLELNRLYPSKFKLILIGGNDPIHETGLSLEEESAYLNCNNIIKVGFSNEVEKYLSISDVFLFPSLKEGMPVCIIEALAMGVPVITANSRGCNDLVFNNVNGLVLSEKPNKEEVVKALMELQNSSNIIAEMKKYSLENRHKLGREVFIDKQTEVYTKLMKL